MANTARDPGKPVIEGVTRADFLQLPTFDSLTLWVPESAIIARTPDELPTGVPRLFTFETGARVTITSKILRDRYAERLNAQTFPRTLELLNESAPIVVDPARVLASATVSALDRTVDLRLPCDPAVYLRALRLPCPEKWIVKRWGSHGVSARNSSRSFNEQLTLYDKYRELLAHPVPGVDPESFRGVLRVEYRVSTARKIRDRFGVADVLLSTLLSCPVNPAMALLRSWRDRFTPVHADGVRGELLRRGALSILDELEHDPAKVELWVKSCGQRADYWVPQILAHMDAASTALLDELLVELSASETESTGTATRVTKD